MMEEEPGTFFLTDFLARHFDRLVIAGSWARSLPAIARRLFRDYRRLVYLAQFEDPELTLKAKGGGGAPWPGF